MIQNILQKIPRIYIKMAFWLLASLDPPKCRLLGNIFCHTQILGYNLPRITRGRFLSWIKSSQEQFEEIHQSLFVSLFITIYMIVGWMQPPQLIRCVCLWNKPKYCEIIRRQSLEFIFHPFNLVVFCWTDAFVYSDHLLSGIILGIECPKSFTVFWP